MELTGKSLIAASRADVWQALNDPAVLARCIEGVETLTATTGADGATRFDGKMNAKVGPVRATFSGGVTLTEVDAPNRYVLVGEGKGGVAGFAKGSAEVALSDAPVDGQNGTLLRYAVSSSVGGKLAQLGARLIEGTARGYADTFFTRLKAEVERSPDLAATAVTDDGVEPQAATTIARATSDVHQLNNVAPRTGLTPLIWSVVIILIVLAVLAWELT